MAIFEEKKYLNRDGVKVLWREVAKEISAEAAAREAADAAEKAAREAADAAEAKARTDADTSLAQSIAGLDTKIGTLPTDSANVIAYINKKTEGIATDTALAELQEAVDAIEEDYLTSADKQALEKAIADEAARADAAEKANAKAIADEAARADEAEKKALADAKAYADGIKADLLGNSDVLEGTYDTLKEINAWITKEGVDATELSSAIATEAQLREAADLELSNRIKAYEDVKDTYATVSALNEVSAVAEAAQTEKEVSDAIDAKITALNLANTYEAKGTAAGLNSAMDVRVQVLEAAKHEHANKALLDTYTQTEADLADAVAKKHDHSNKAVLDGITATQVSNWDAEVGKATSVYNAIIPLTANDITTAIEEVKAEPTV